MSSLPPGGALALALQWCKPDGQTRSGKSMGNRDSLGRRIDEREKQRTIDHGHAKGREERQREREANAPPCPLVPPGTSQWFADGWLDGYLAELKARG